MDVGGPRPYVTGAMSFLLVLSAVFNALTGAFVGARPAEPVAQQQAATTAVLAEAVETRAVPTTHDATPAVVSEAPTVAETPAPPAAPPLETDRLLE